jgi:hypothetical protein
MIVRQAGPDLLLISQPDHARLAATLVAAWRAHGLPSRPTRDIVLFATAHHDDGWRAEDAAPSVNPATGRPHDFVDLPADQRRAIWPRAVAHLSETSVYSAALVAQHALTIYRRFRSDPDWNAFFAAMEIERDRFFTAPPRPGGGGTPPDPPVDGRASFLEDYTTVRIGDLLSLLFCNDWHTTEGLDGYAMWMDHGTLRVAPDPFDGAAVAFDIRARRVPARRYQSASDLQDAIAAAPFDVLTGTAAGAAAVS